MSLSFWLKSKGSFHRASSKRAGVYLFELTFLLAVMKKTRLEGGNQNMGIASHLEVRENILPPWTWKKLGMEGETTDFVLNGLK